MTACVMGLEGRVQELKGAPEAYFPAGEEIGRTQKALEESWAIFLAASLSFWRELLNFSWLSVLSLASSHLLGRDFKDSPAYFLICVVDLDCQ